MRKKYLLLTLILVLSFVFTGCKSSDYKKAVEMQDNGDYSGAASLYQSIGNDYKDVSSRIEFCQAYLDAEDAYNKVVEELKAKNTELDETVKKASDLVNGDEKALDEELRPKLESVISGPMSRKRSN